MAGSRKLVLNGRSTSFWSDRWLSDRSLNDICERPANAIEDSRRVSDFLNDSGSWDWDQIGDVPQSVKDQLALVNLNHDLDEKLIWGVAANGLFSVSSAYHSLLNK